MTEPISTARIRNVEVPMISHADIKQIPTIEGPVKDSDLGAALEALNDRRLATPDKVHLYEGDAHHLGSIAADGTVVLHTKNLRSEANKLAKKYQIPIGRAARVLYRELLDGCTSWRLVREFIPEADNMSTLQAECNRNARRSEILPLLAFPTNNSTLVYRPGHRYLAEKAEPTLW